MVINRHRDFSVFRFLLTLFLIITCCTNLWVYAAGSTEKETDTIDYAAFYKALEEFEDNNSIQLGNAIFSQLEKKYRADAGFGALKSKLMAAEFLAKQMISQLEKATQRQMSAVAGKIFENRKKTNDNALGVAPAKKFYDTSKELFSRPVKISELEKEEREFLSKYYDLKLRINTSSIAKAGQALAIAEPGFKGTHDYVLVLPLLHASDNAPVSINVLPRWMHQPEQLDVFSDSCLRNYGFVYHAMVMAEKSAQVQGKVFSKLDFYKSAVGKYSKSHPHIAVESLHRAIEVMPNKDPNEIVPLQFEIVQLWFDIKSYPLAAGQAREISEIFPNHDRAGEAIWLYYYALSRCNNIDQILAGIDNAIKDKRCELYRAKLMYTKWWTLRRKKDRGASVVSLEYELLKKYADNPVIAPILFSRATDLSAIQNYNGAYDLLNHILEKFPESNIATDARKMIVNLKKRMGI